MSDWKQQLNNLFSEEYRKNLKKKLVAGGNFRIKNFLSETVVPAFEEVAEELSNYGKDVDVEVGKKDASVTVSEDGDEEFFYSIRVRVYKERKYVFPVIPLSDEEGQVYRAEVHLKSGPTDHDVTTYTKDQIIENFLYEYRRHIRWNT
jgi:choline/glycine/proline betaine transport protein